MINAIASISEFHKKAEIESRYNRTVAAFQEQSDMAIRMVKAEFRMKCHIAKALHEAELRELERDKDAR